MTVESDVQAAPVQAPAAPAGNPALLALMTFLPSGITLGLFFVGYLTAVGAQVPIVALSAGVFLLISSIWAARLGASTVAAIFGVFSAFWLSFALLLAGVTSGWWGIVAADDPATPAAETVNLPSVLSTYLLSFLIVFVFLTLATLRLPLAFTAGFVFVSITFALAFFAFSAGATNLLPIAGITTFIFCAIFAYILYDGIQQELGGRALPMGSALIK